MEKKLAPCPRLRPGSGSLSPPFQVEASGGAVEEHEVVHAVLRDVKGCHAEPRQQSDCRGAVVCAREEEKGRERRKGGGDDKRSAVGLDFFFFFFLFSTSFRFFFFGGA